MTASVEVPPKRLRWKARSAVVAELRPRVSRFLFCVFGAVWNIAIVGGLKVFTSERHPTFDWTGVVAASGFLLLALRETLLVTRVSFEGGRLLVRAKLAPWVRLDVPSAAVASFAVAEQEDGTYRVFARMHDGLSIGVPLHFETVPIRASWTRRAPFALPAGYAAFLATRLTAMLKSSN